MNQFILDIKMLANISMFLNCLPCHIIEAHIREGKQVYY